MTMERGRDRFTRKEVYISVAVLVLAWIGCRLYLPSFRAAGGHAMTYYEEFGPAVMAACGHGFLNPPTPSVPALDAFLASRANAFDCRELNEMTGAGPMNDFQSVTRNLLFAAAAIWRVTGISWTALDNLAAAMFSVTVMAAYVVMRFAMGRLLALAGTFVWGISPMHLDNVAHLRDYSKAPFFVLTLLAIAAAVVAKRPKTLVAIGAAFGVIQGIGLGMRTDVGLNFLPFFLALFLLGTGDARKHVSWKFLAAALAVLLFVVSAWPVLSVYRHSEGLWHVSLLGLTTPFDAALNIRRAPYDFGYLYDDSYMSTVVHAFWFRVHDVPQTYIHGSGGFYNAACRAYYALLVSTFPGDFVTRMMGSALHVLDLPFSASYGRAPLGFTGSWMAALAWVRSFVMLRLSGVGPIAAAYLLLLIGMRDRIAACVGFVLLMFWVTYPYLQFHPRHVFHLEILTIVVLLWAAQLSWTWLVAARAASTWRHESRLALKSAAVVLAFVGIVVSSVAVARVVQAPRARLLLATYDTAAEERVDVLSVPDGGTVRLAPTLFEPDRHRFRLQQAMLVLNASNACGSGDIPVHMRYSSNAGTGVDFSRDLTIRIPSSSGSSRVFLPVYSVEGIVGNESRFLSVDVPQRMASCIRLSRARHLERLPLMLDATLPGNWRQQPLHERLYLGQIMPAQVWVRVSRWWPRLAELG